MPWAKRRAPSSVERSTADVVQLSRRCGTDVLRRGSCELALEIAVGIGYHAEWQTQGVLHPARGRVVPAEFRQKLQCDLQSELIAASSV